MELFAQQGRGGGADAAAGMFAGLLIFYAIAIAIGLFIQIMFLLSMSRCLKQISRRNRQMEPGQVWLCLIPIFGFIWTIIMILRVADSLKDEYYDRGLRGDGDFGKTLGIVYIVSAFVCGIVAIICFIMYWVKIAGYTKALMESTDDDEDEDRPRRRRRDEDDDEDDRPRRRGADADEGEDDDRPRRRRD